MQIFTSAACDCSRGDATEANTMLKLLIIALGCAAALALQRLGDMPDGLSLSPGGTLEVHVHNHL